MTQLSAQELISLHDLKAHPEGGYYKETYRSAHSTAIYFLLPAGTRSLLHRIPADEVWHFYLGGPLIVASISPEGVIETVTLGTDLRLGQRLQHVVPAGHWFGAFPAPNTAYSLVGCTVAPPFEFSGLEMGSRASLVKQYPHARELIERLT